MKKNINKRSRKKNVNLFDISFRESWDYVKESRDYIFMIVGIFLVTSIFGFVYPNLFTEQIKEFIKNLVSQTEGLNAFQLIIFIFKNNLSASFMGFFLGAFFGFIPIIVAVFNGYLLGFIAKFAADADGIFTLWRLFPHGIFELPAVFISLAMGLKMGFFIFAKNPKREFYRRLVLGIKTFISIVVPLLIVAAVIEGSLIRLLG